MGGRQQTAQKSTLLNLPAASYQLSAGKHHVGIMQQEASLDKEGGKLLQERGRQAGAEVEESFTCLATGPLKAGAAEAGSPF